MLRPLTFFMALLLLATQLSCSTANKVAEVSIENKPEWFDVEASNDLGAVSNYSTGNGYLGSYTMGIRVRAQKEVESEKFKILQVQARAGMSWARVYFRHVTGTEKTYKFDFGGQTYYFSL